MIKRKTGLSQNAGITAKDFKAYKSAGIDCLEISPSENQYDSLHISRIKELADEYGVELRSFHLRFCNFEKYDISTTDETSRRYVIDYHKRFIRECSMIGINIFVIHSSGEPIDNIVRADRILCAKKSLCELAEYAAAYNAVIAVEDLPRSCLGNNSKELLDIVSCDERLKICFDTNHLLSEDHYSFLHAVASKIVTTHFSDYDFINERHWLPGEGDINWKALMDTFDEVDYTGPVVYELLMVASSLKTITRPRDLTPADIKLNHNELDNRSELTIIGKRLPDLGK